MPTVEFFSGCRPPLELPQLTLFNSAPVAEFKSSVAEVYWQERSMSSSIFVKCQAELESLSVALLAPRRTVSPTGSPFSALLRTVKHENRARRKRLADSVSKVNLNPSWMRRASPEPMIGLPTEKSGVRHPQPKLEPLEPRRACSGRAPLTLLNQSQLGIEAAQLVVVLMERGCVIVAQAQIEHQSRLDAPVILKEPSVPLADGLKERVADQLISPTRKSGEKVFQGCGIGNLRDHTRVEIERGRLPL